VYAPKTPLKVFIAPGPVVAQTTAGFPATLAYPSSGRYTRYIRAASTATNGANWSPAYTATSGGVCYVDNITFEEVIPSSGTIATDSTFLQLGNEVFFKLATPVTTPLNTAGVLMSNPSGTIYREYALADAGLYSTKMDILLTSYPISTLEEIKVIDAQGNETYLDVSAAVIASNGLSFTHPSLVAGNLVFFSYFFEQERVEGETTVSYYDSRVVKLDTANGKFYKITFTVTNGVVALTATEV
jgi:hypothetical protein